MVIALTVLVLILIGTVSGLIAAAVTRRAAAQRVDAVVRTFDPDRPPGHDVEPLTLDRALDELERISVSERQRRERGVETENRLAWALGAIANGVVIFDERGEIAYRNDPAPIRLHRDEPEQWNSLWYAAGPGPSYFLAICTLDAHVPPDPHWAVRTLDESSLRAALTGDDHAQMLAFGRAIEA